MPPGNQVAGASGSLPCSTYMGHRGPTHRNTITWVEVRAGDIGDGGDELVVDLHAAEEGALVVGVSLYLPRLGTQRIRMNKCTPEATPERPGRHSFPERRSRVTG